MTLENLANTAEVIGVIAVVASLLFVGRQIRETNRDARSQSRQAIINTFSDLTYELTHHIDLIEIVSAGIDDWNSLSNMEKTRFENIMGRYLMNIEKGRLMFEDGVLDQPTFDGIANFMLQCLMMPGGKTWFDQSVWPSPALRSYLNARLTDEASLPRPWDEAIPFWAALAKERKGGSP